MGWVKLDDGFPMHPKVVDLSLDARWAYIESLCYAARYRTDGVVPDKVAANGPVRAELMASGLWESGTASNVCIHDYLAYNLSRADYDERAEAGSLGGQARAQALASAPATAPAQAGAKAGGERPPEHPLKQVGTPSRPVPSISSKASAELDASFAAFWTEYPRKVGKPKAKTAFRQALKRASAEDIILGAKRYAADPNREDEFTAHPTTWLHRDGWEDPPQPQRARSRRPPDPPRPMTDGEFAAAMEREALDG